jgi:hypothetical protein
MGAWSPLRYALRPHGAAAGFSPGASRPDGLATPVEINPLAPGSITGRPAARVTQLLRPARSPRSPCGSRGRRCQGGRA